jgi:hypothetical protein
LQHSRDKVSNIPLNDEGVQSDPLQRRHLLETFLFPVVGEFFFKKFVISQAALKGKAENEKQQYRPSGYDNM